MNAILYKFKTGVQWHLLPVKSLINSASIKYGAVFHHFRKWVKDGSWWSVQQKLISQYKQLLNLSLDIRERLERLIGQPAESEISVDGLFVNADAGFGSYEFKEACLQAGIQLNMPRNYRSASHLVDDDTFSDELVYKQRYAVERTNAWMDSNCTLLVRQDTSIESWPPWHYIFCIKQWINHLIKL